MRRYQLVILCSAALLIVAGSARGQGSAGANQPEYSNAQAVDVFTDINGHWGAPFIHALYNAGITQGCSWAQFCPEWPVSRSQMAVFLVRAMGATPLFPPVPTFSDVPPSHWAYGYIERFYQLNLTSGCGVNPLRYCPEDPLRRDQMAVFIVKAKGWAPAAPQWIFADVPPSYWAAGYIEEIYWMAVTIGCSSSPRLYCPLDNVSRAQMATFIVRAYTLPISPYTSRSSWYVDSIGAIWVAGLVSNPINGAIGFVEVTAELYSSSDQLLATDFGFASLTTIPGGGDSSYDILILDPPPGVHHVFVRITDYWDPSPYPPVTGLVWNITNIYVDWIGYRHVVGTVYNASAETYYYVQPYVAAFDTNGWVVRTDFTFTAPSTLPPFTYGTFDTSYPADGVNVAWHWIWVDAA